MAPNNNKILSRFKHHPHRSVNSQNLGLKPYHFDWLGKFEVIISLMTCTSHIEFMIHVPFKFIRIFCLILLHYKVYNGIIIGIYTTHTPPTHSQKNHTNYYHYYRWKELFWKVSFWILNLLADCMKFALKTSHLNNFSGYYRYRELAKRWINDPSFAQQNIWRKNR